MYAYRRSIRCISHSPSHRVGEQRFAGRRAPSHFAPGCGDGCDLPGLEIRQWRDLGPLADDMSDILRMNAVDDGTSDLRGAIHANGFGARGSRWVGTGRAGPVPERC